MSGSAIHTALSGLVAVYQAVGVTLTPSVEVVRCRPYDPQQRFLCVGWDHTEQPAVTALPAAGNAGLAGVVESMDVSNLLTFWSGNQTESDVETDLFTAYDAFDAGLAADRDLGGAAALARVTVIDYIPDIRPEGALAQIRFTVRIDVL